MADVHEHFHTSKNVTLRDIATRFNIYHSPDYYNVPNPSNGHIFMTVPDMELTQENIMRDEMLAGLCASEGFDVYKNLLMGGKGFIPIVHNRAISYGVKPFNLNVIEKGLTYFGNSVHYGKHSSDRNKAYSFSIDFYNDEYTSILKIMAIWSRYIWLVSRGRISPQAKYEVSAQLDYAASLYYFNTDLNNTKINFWEKLVGVFPTSSPLDLYSKEEGPKLVDKVSIDFECSLPDDPFSILTLHEFATQTGGLLNHMPYTKVNRVGMILSDKPRLYVTDNQLGTKSKAKLEWYLGWE